MRAVSPAAAHSVDSKSVSRHLPLALAAASSRPVLSRHHCASSDHPDRHPGNQGSKLHFTQVVMVPGEKLYVTRPHLPGSVD